MKKIVIHVLIVFYFSVCSVLYSSEQSKLVKQEQKAMLVSLPEVRVYLNKKKGEQQASNNRADYALLIEKGSLEGKDQEIMDETTCCKSCCTWWQNRKEGCAPSLVGLFVYFRVYR